MELIVAEVERGIDGLEWLEVDVDSALFALAGDDFAAVDDKAIGRDAGVELEALLGRGDCREDRKTVHSGFDIGGRALIFSVGVSTYDVFSK